MKLVAILVALQLWAEINAAPTIEGNTARLQVPGLGTIIGQVKNTTLNRPDLTVSPPPRQYLAFRRIPYVQAPLGNLRFRDPVPLDSWPSGVLNATAEAPVCSQWHSVFLRTRGQEDCLYLNVYTPDPDRSLPVMVYFHGGAFYMGSGNPDTDRMGPRYLLTRDVVLVTVNYRLGPAGFFSLGDKDAPGNYGMLDQVAALQWVQKNIAAFGGNPDSVTIFGNSAGSASVTMHMLSPRSKGLFHRVIAESGSALCNWGAIPTTTEYARLMVEAENCTRPTTNEILDCLRQKPSLELAGWRKQVELKGFCMGMCPLAFNPRVDAERDEPFLPRQPAKIVEAKQFNPAPLIIGMTSQEGAIIVAPLKQKAANGTNNFEILASDPEHYIQYLMGYELRPDGRKWARRALDEYTDPNVPLTEQIHAIAELATDALFSSCTPSTAQLFSSNSDQPAYLYYFRHRGAYTQPDLAGVPAKPDLGVCHTDELFLLFSSGLYPDIRRSDDVQVSELLLDLWTSFASSGTPSSSRLSQQWTPLKNKQITYLEVNQGSARVTSDALPYSRRLPFWKQIYASAGW